MDEARHWNNIGNSYNQQIFDVFASDKLKLLPQYFSKHANTKGVALDFGCGNGKAFEHIAPLFKKIIGVDISRELLKQALARGFANVSLLQSDLSKTKVKLPPADFVFSCNVIMLPEVEKNYSMLQNIQRTLKPGGQAVLVVPSAESILFSSWRLIDWYQREGTSAKDVSPSELNYFKGRKHEIIQGIFYIDNVPTKHYSQPELEVIIKKAKLKLTKLEKLEYSWRTEFSKPPKWMKDPYPWDWLVECVKP